MRPSFEPKGKINSEGCLLRRWCLGIIVKGIQGLIDLDADFILREGLNKESNSLLSQITRHVLRFLLPVQPATTLDLFSGIGR